MNKFKGFLALLSCAVIFASFSIFVRILSQELQPYQQIGFRNVIALVIGTIAVIASKQSFSTLKKVETKFIILYTMTFPIAVILYTLAVLQTTIITSIFGLYLGSLITSLIVGILFFKEKLNNMKILSLVLVLIGLISYTYPFDFSTLGIGFLLSILSGFFDASANSFRKYLAGKVDRFVLVVLQMVGGLGVAVALMTIFKQTSLPSLSPTSWVVGLLFGLCLVAISYLTLIGFQNFDLNLGTVVLSSEIFFASIFAFVFFQETSTFTQLLGGVLIVVATGVANIAIEKESRVHKMYRSFLTGLRLS